MEKNTSPELHVYHPLENGDAEDRVSSSIRVKLYLLISGMLCMAPLTIGLTLMDVGKDKFSNYYYPFYYMMTDKSSLITFFPILQSIRSFSYRNQILVSLAILTCAMSGFVYLLMTVENTGLGSLLKVLAFPLLSSVSKEIVIAANVRISTFYESSTAPYVLTGLPIFMFTMSISRMVLNWMSCTNTQFVIYFYVWFIVLLASAVFLLQSISKEDHYKESEKKASDQRDKITVKEMWKSFLEIKWEFLSVVYTVSLFSTVHPQVFIYLKPEFFGVLYWINLLSIESGISNILGQYLGGTKCLDWVVGYLHWFPLASTLFVSYQFIWGNPGSFNRLWILTLCLDFVLSFRSFFTQTTYIRGRNKLGNHNHCILLTYSAEVAFFISAFFSMGLIWMREHYN